MRERTAAATTASGTRGLSSEFVEMGLLNEERGRRNRGVAPSLACWELKASITLEKVAPLESGEKIMRTARIALEPELRRVKGGGLWQGILLASALLGTRTRTRSGVSWHSPCPSSRTVSGVVH